MKNWMVSFGFILTAFVGLSQSNKVDVESIGNQWQSYFENNQVKIQVKKENCSFPQEGIHQQFLLFKYQNKLSQAIVVDLHNDFYYNDQCSTCGVDEYNYSFSIDPNSSLEATCDLLAPGYKTIFVKQTNMNTSSELTSVELTDIKVEEEE